MASLVQSLPPLLETALEQLEGGVLPFDAVCQAVDHANAVCCFATAWAHSGGITGGAAALRRWVCLDEDCAGLAARCPSWSGSG